MDVSVVIPVYNAAPFVEKAVISALQLEEVKEVLLIEDGSPDNAIEICRKLDKEHERVKLFQHPDKGNHGASASRNLGLISASFPFIAFLDADDFFLPNRFVRDEIIFAKNSNADGVYNGIGVNFITEKGKCLFFESFSNDLTTVNGQFSDHDVFRGLIGAIPGFGHFSLDGLTIKREALNKMDKWFNSSLRLHEDSEFIIRLSFYCSLIGGELKIPVALRGVHDHNQITNLFSNPRKAEKNKFFFWRTVFEWARMEEIKKKELALIEKNFLFFKIRSSNYLHSFFIFVFACIFKRGFFSNPSYYNGSIYRLFGSGFIGRVFIKLKEKFQIEILRIPLN